MTERANEWKGLRLATPSNYRIRVQGHMGKTWADRMGSLVVTPAFSEDGKPETILVGRIDDQKTLSQILNALYDLRLPLLSVERLAK